MQTKILPGFSEGFWPYDGAGADRTEGMGEMDGER